MSLRTPGWGGYNWSLLERAEDAVRSLVEPTNSEGLSGEDTNEAEDARLTAVRNVLQAEFNADEWETLRRIWGSRSYIIGVSATAIQRQIECDTG